MRAHSVVILGSKPNAALPAVSANVVLTANASVELGVKYRERYNSYLVSLVGSGELKNKKYVQNAIAQSYPDEVIVHGEKIDTPGEFIAEKLGLRDTKVKVLSFYERYQLMAERVGIFAPLIGMKSIGIKAIKTVVKDIFGTRSMRWTYCSTGMYAIIYAMKHYPDADEFITAGIGLQGGAHYYGIDIMRPGRAKVDRRVMKYWKRNDRPKLYTTDEMMSKLGNVPIWEGEVFYF